MTSFTTIGVISWKISLGLCPVSALPSCGRSLYVHACLRLATLAVLICVSGEYRVPARSRLNIGPSASALLALFFCAVPRVAGRNTIATAAIKKTNRGIRIESTPYSRLGGILSRVGSLCNKGVSLLKISTHQSPLADLEDPFALAL